MTSVLVAMSGGVDSSVAAALALEAGHDVIGVTLKLWEGPGGVLPTAGCCTVSDAEDARRVAARLDIPYYVLDYTGDFRDGVVDRFVSDYVAGRTPNPCIECNRTVKFSRLLRQAEELGCTVVVTGHYARTRVDGGRHRLLRGVDRAKDQSYVLSMLGQEELARVWFPVGELTKAETRRIAADLGLRTAAKPDSQDICFVGAGDYRSFVATRAPEARRPGVIVTSEGEVVGEHDGVVNYTIGQRRGLGLAVGEARYVTAIDAATATVTIGRKQDLAVDVVELTAPGWVWSAPPDGTRVSVQLRAHGDAVPAILRGRRLELETPELGVAPGQTAAIYDGDEVIGGGVVAAARCETAASATRERP